MGDVLVTRTTHTCLTVATVIALAAALVLGFGSGEGRAAFAPALPGKAVMAPLTAASFLMISVALGLHIYAPYLRRTHVITSTTACVVFGIVLLPPLCAAFNLQEYIAPVIPLALISPHAGAMPLATSLCFVLAAASVAFLPWHKFTEMIAIHTIPIFGFFVASLSFTGHLIHQDTLIAVFPYSRMALHTAALFMMLFVAITLSIPNRPWVNLLVTDGQWNQAARRTATLLLIVPPIMTYALLLAQHIGLDSQSILILFTILISVTFFTLLLTMAQQHSEYEAEMTKIVGQLENALEDRKVVLREVYHRVKNNLQQVDALINFEARKHHRNPRVLESFKATSNRLHAIALVHRLLLKDNDLSSVNLREFMIELTEGLIEAGGFDVKGIEIILKVEATQATLSSATSLGLLVNEIVGNAIKHAFPSGPGQITITLETDLIHQGCKRLVVSDNGIGFDPRPEGRKVGLRIVGSLVGQLKGKLSITSESGTRVSICVPASILIEQN